MKRFRMETDSHPDDAHAWIGREATVGSQAQQHLRHQEKHVEGLFSTIVGLTFLGGVTLGCALSHLWRKKK
jgi:hypothetical protein